MAALDSAGGIRIRSMTVVEFTHSNPQDPLQRLVRIARVRTDQTICVAGPGSQETMTALRHAGHDRVKCARQAIRAGVDEISDLLILTGSPESLGSLCARMAPLVRNGGVVAAWLNRAEDDPLIRTALLVHGMEITTSVVDIGDGLVVMHRVWRSARLAKAS